MTKNKLNELPTITRWLPNHRYLDNKKTEFELSGFKSTEKSMTDKEAYRVNLSSLRGTLASGLGNIKVGQYSLKENESYEPAKDFSYINRPDVSLVELHEFIENMRSNLENYDNEVKIKVQEELKVAEAKAKELEKAELAKATKSKSSEE